MSQIDCPGEVNLEVTATDTVVRLVLRYGDHAAAARAHAATQALQDMNAAIDRAVCAGTCRRVVTDGWSAPSYLRESVAWALWPLFRSYTATYRLTKKVRCEQTEDGTPMG